MEGILTFDLGTTACKTTLFNLEGDVIAQAEQEYPLYHPQPMWAEQEADDWWDAAVATCRQILAERDVKIQGIGLSSQRETMVPLDSQGRPLSRAIVWMDRRAAGEAEELAREVGREQLHQRTGMIPDSTFSATKLFWWYRNAKEIIDQAMTFLQPKEYLAYRLTGAIATEPSLASRTMLYDIREGRWCSDLVSLVGLKEEQLPKLVASTDVVGKLTGEAASALGLPQGVPVVAGGGDRQCEALGSGISGELAMESTGTTSNLSFATTRLPEKLDPRVVSSCHALPGQWLIEQGLTTTGSILRWFRDNFAGAERIVAGELGASSYDLISQEAAGAKPGSDKLLLLPFFMGAKATRWNPAARGALFGLTLDHGRKELARAIMEGVAYELRACLDVLEGMKMLPEQIVLMGGGSKGELWNQIKANVTGFSVGLPKQTEAASLGAFILAGAGIGLFPDPGATSRTLNPVVRKFEVNQGDKTVYDSLYPLYNRLYEVTEEITHKLAEVEG
jgi:xylulokinase